MSEGVPVWQGRNLGACLTHLSQLSRLIANWYPFQTIVVEPRLLLSRVVCKQISCSAVSSGAQFSKDSSL